MTLAVYAQVMSHQFIILDDRRYIRENPIVRPGTDTDGNRVGIHNVLRRQLAPTHMAFPHARLPNLWPECRWASDSQRADPCVATLCFCFYSSDEQPVLSGKAQSSRLFSPSTHCMSSRSPGLRNGRILYRRSSACSALLAYARYIETPSWKRYALVAVALALGLMAKPMLVTWPFVLLLLDYWPLRRYQWRRGTGTAGFFRALVPLVREKLPLFCLAAASMVITFVAQSHGGAVRTFVQVPTSVRLSNAIVSYAKYLFRTLWPSDLAVYYPFSRTGVPVWELLCAIVLLTAVTVFVFRQARERPYLLVGWLWFVGTLVPVIGLVTVGGAAMADRYHYVPSIGLFVASVFGLSDLAPAFRINRVVVGTITVAALSILTCLTAVQIGRWRNSATLFKYPESLVPDNRMIENNLGTILGDNGK